jgi:hypothetical protein
MTPRQLLFLGGVGFATLIAAVVTGPMLIDALLGTADAPVSEVAPEAADPAPHPAVAP